MATLEGVGGNVHTIEGYAGAVSPLQVALVQFTISGTYVQGDNATLLAVPTLIQNSRRNGKTVTIRDAMCGHHATKESNPALLMGLKTVAVSTNDLTFEITEAAAAGVGEFSTELAAGAVPAQARPFSVLVSFTEA